MRSTVRTVLFLFITGAFGHAQTFQLKNEPYPPTLAIDPATKTGSTTLQIQNTGSEPTLSLRADDFISTTTNHKLGAKITFSDETANAPKSPYSRTIPAGQTASIKMDVSNLWEAGESKAVLYSGNAIVGYVIASNDRFAMNITVQSDNGTSDIRLVNGKNVALTFKNNDAVSYPVRWTMRLKGKEFIGSTVNLGANGAAFVEFKPPAEWFPSSFFTLFKDEEQNAEVILTYAPEPSTGASFLPTKHIPVKVHLSAMQDGRKQPIGYVLVLILLLAGGITSLVLSFGLPNRLQRLTLKERLEKVTATISAISRGVDSRLRVLMRVERKRLDEQLGSRWAFSPDLTDVFVQVDAGISALSAKVDVVDQLDQRRGILTDLIFKGDLGPSLVVQIDAVLQQCADLLRQPQTTNDDLAAARTLLGKADQLLSEKGQTEQAAQDLAKRVEALDQALAPYRATATYAHLEFRFACLFAELNPLNKDPKNIKPADIARLDNAISRLELLQQFIRRAECHSIDQSALASPPDSPLSYPLSGPWGPFSYFDSSPPQLAVDPNERFLAQFDSESWDSFREARLFLRELKQLKYPEELRNALLANIDSATIEINRSPRQNDPLEFSVTFHDDNLNRAAAREEWRYTWNFGDDLTEFTTWTVWHYFRKPGRFNVSVTFEDLQGKKVLQADMKTPLEVKRTVSVDPEIIPFFGERTWIELIKLAIALFVAGIGLIAGARDQLLKLDPVPGLIAVFIAGFGADTIKNLIKK